jgi:hypothetical protein
MEVYHHKPSSGDCVIGLANTPSARSSKGRDNRWQHPLNREHPTCSERAKRSHQSADGRVATKATARRTSNRVQTGKEMNCPQLHKNRIDNDRPSHGSPTRPSAWLWLKVYASSYKPQSINAKDEMFPMPLFLDTGHIFDMTTRSSDISECILQPVHDSPAHHIAPTWQCSPAASASVSSRWVARIPRASANRSGWPWKNWSFSALHTSTGHWI